MSENPTGKTWTFGPSGSAKSPALNLGQAVEATPDEEPGEVVAKVVQAEDKPAPRKTTAATKD